VGFFEAGFLGQTGLTTHFSGYFSRWAATLGLFYSHFPRWPATLELFLRPLLVWFNHLTQNSLGYPNRRIHAPVKPSRGMVTVSKSVYWRGTG
jgi:hypothetical protein